jgi:hypothetical protein
MPLAKDGGFDAAVFDREMLPVALIQVKARPLGKEWTPLLLSELKRRRFPPADFLLAIDPACIHLYRLTEKELSDPVVHLGTPKVLSHYDPDFTGKRIFEPYLLTLTEAWLRDLAYHWKSPNPPGSEELKAAGFLGRVEGGTTQRPEE